MKMVRCQKCGATVISDETFLQNVLDAVDACNRNAHKAKGAEKQVWCQQAAGYMSMFKAFMHNLSRIQEANDRHMHILGELRFYVLNNELMTREQLDMIYKKGEARATDSARQANKEIQRIYGEFDSACNRTMPNPTERGALRRCGR